MVKSNLYPTNKAAEKELTKRIRQSKIIYKADRIFYIAPGKYFVGTYSEYKLYLDI